jgi:ADP-heptose:LPS heptosyltransferase
MHANHLAAITIKHDSIVYLIAWIISAAVKIIDYRCENRRFWLSAHNYQVPTPTSQNPQLEQQIRIFGADKLINCLEDWNPQFLISRSIYQKKANCEKLGLGIGNPYRIVFWVCGWTSAWRRGFKTGIFGILESSATQWYQDVAPT